MHTTRFRITPSVIARYFKHRCDRLFRWDTVRGADRGKAGIGWGIPARKKLHNRPGIQLLMQSGERFEVDQLEDLISEWGAAHVLHAGIEDTDILPLGLEAFLAACRAEERPRFIAQIELNLYPHPTWAAGFLNQFNLDPNTHELGLARPDLIEIRPAPEGPDQLRVWDFKASQCARHEHFIQVAYYALLLDHILRAAELPNLAVDLEDAGIYSYQGLETFALKPYLLAVDDFLRNRVPTLLAVSGADAHFHVAESCALCDYMTTCKDEADAGRDLSRVAYMTSTAKRKLNESGIRTHRELAHLEDEADIARLKTRNHNLSVNLHRYIATAQALEDGVTRDLEATTLLMPQYEDVRVVLSAEQDAVTGTCFALGLKTFEGWDNGKPVGIEKVFLSPAPEHEADLLLDFLQTLNAILVRVDAENSAVDASPLADHPACLTAKVAQETAGQALAAFKAEHSYIHPLTPNAKTLRAERDALKAAEKKARQAVKETERSIAWERRKKQKCLHFYVYDTLDLLVLQKLLERHLLTEDIPELQDEIKTLVRLFPPASVLPDAETFRSMPGTVVTQVLRTMVALPAPYLYDLRTVSERYQPAGADGTPRGFVFKPRYGFAWEHSNQVPFERIHDLWKGQTFKPDGYRPARAFPPARIREELIRTVQSKLRATDSIVRRLKQDLQDRLLLRKEPFRLYKAFDPFNFQVLEALRVFSIMETALQELGIKHLHTLPATDRSAKFACIRGLHFENEDGEGNLWFSFDPDSRDAKFSVGDFNLVLTPEAQPNTLLEGVDGQLFDKKRWRHAAYQVSLEAYNLQADPPRVCLCPNNRNQFNKKIDLSQRHVLDHVFVDYNSDKILSTLARLQTPEARHIQNLIASGTIHHWTPAVQQVAEVEAAMQQKMHLEVGVPSAMNPGQWRAWRGVFQEPLTMIWGPPGTGKTYTLGHILLGYALATEATGKSVCLLVTAFTHHAIVNVLKKVAELAERYQIGPDVLQVFKAQGRVPHAADAELPAAVNTIPDDQVGHILDMGWPCLIVGATVWATHKALKKTGDPLQPWFDVVLVDEASQLKLPDALLALSAAKSNSNIILAGDDQQLPPIIHGTYPEDHAPLLTSVFAFMRHRMEEADDPELTARRLFQLETNFRMNEPLTAYPREVLYEGRFFSDQPTISITLNQRLEHETTDPLDCMLHPDRPVVLCSYSPPQSFTSRNPIEAELVTALTRTLARILIDQTTGEAYTPQRFAAHGLAILSPHRAQNSTIRNALTAAGFDTPDRPMPIIDTVDKLQGQERDVVLVSYGVADEEYAEAEAAFLLSRNRFNVAATRARQKLIVFCSDAVLDVVPTDRQILLDALMLKEFRRYCDDGQQRLTWPSAEYGDVVLNIQWKGFN